MAQVIVTIDVDDLARAARFATALHLSLRPPGDACRSVGHGLGLIQFNAAGYAAGLAVEP